MCPLRFYPATPGWGVRRECVCARAQVSAAPRHSWLGCWGVCVFVCVLRLYPATPSWGVRPGCVCLGLGFGCVPPLLGGVLGCVCARVPAPLVPGHSWLGCVVPVCVFGLGFRRHPASPGWGVGVCVCSCARSASTRSLLAGVCGVGVCAWARVSALSRLSWLGCWGVCVLVCPLRLYPATPGWGVWCGSVCLGSGFGCTPPLLAGVLGGVCVPGRPPLVPRHSWLGCAAWACVLGLGSRLRPATPGWGVGVCVCSCARSACSPPLLAGVCGACVRVWARVSAAPRHSWLACCGGCVFVCPLCLYPATPGWGVWRGCVCLGSGFCCASPLLAGVLGCVCVRVRAPLVPRHSWLGCASWVCVLGLGSRLRPATPGWGVGVCVCSCARSACTPPLLAGVCAVGVCALASVSAAPRHSWLGCSGMCVLVCPLCLYPATPGWGVWCGCVCFGLGFSCASPLLAGVLGCVCVGVRAPLVPRHSWLGCSAWVCVLGLGFRLRPAAPGWGVGVCGCSCAPSACSPPLLDGVCGVCVCFRARVSAAPRHSWLGCWGVGVFVCPLRLYLASPGWGVWCGCVCLGSGFGCAPPLLAGVLACVCVCVPAPLVPRHSWLGWAVWVCLLGLGFRLRPATPGWGVGVCVCLCACSACTPPLLAGVCGVGVCAWTRVSAAPRHSWLGCWGVCVFVCALSLYPATPGWGLRRGCVGWVLPGTCSPAAVPCVLCALPGFAAPGGRCRLAPVRVPRIWPAACLSGVPCGSALARRASSGPVALGAPVGFPDAVVPFPIPRGLRPQIYWAAARGRWRLAENRALCACRWPLPRQGLWARSASYPFRAPRWGCPWRVPPASVLGCVRCVGWRVWTRSLTRPVSRTARLSTGDSAGAPGLFRVDADTSPCGSEDATPGSRACVRARALVGQVGRAGLPGAFWCASPFPVAALSLFSVRPPPGLSRPVCCVFFFSSLCAPPLSLAFRVFRPGVPWALASCSPPPFFRFLFLLHAPPLPPVFFSCTLVFCSLLFFVFFCFCLVCCFVLFFFLAGCAVRCRFVCLWLCSVVLCCRVVVCCCALPSVCVVACACCLFPGAALSAVCVLVCFPVVGRLVLAPCSPVLCPVVLCCLVVLRCHVLLPFAVLCVLAVAFGVVFRWCCPCLAVWLAALWFCVVCLGAPLRCVVFCGAVLSRGGVPSCPAVCLRRCLCLLFVSWRCAFCCVCPGVLPCGGSACCGALLPCVVSRGAVLSYGAALSCSGVCMRCCVCLRSLLSFRTTARPPPPAPAGVTTGGRTRTSAHERRTSHARGRHATTNRSSMGAAPPMTWASPMTPAMLPAQGGQRDGPRQNVPPAPRPPGHPSGGPAHEPPLPPPPASSRPHPARLGLPHNPNRTRTPGGGAPATRGGKGRGLRAAPPREGGREPRRDPPPPVPPPSPTARKPWGRLPPPPPRQRG